MILAPKPSSRYELMDIGRGFAILGILWVNILTFGLPYEAMVIPGIWGESNDANILIWNTITVGMSGVMRGMISMLFGAAAVIMLHKAETGDTGFNGLDRYFRRLLWLVFFGVVHGYFLLWPHDILYVYGVLGLFIFPFRNLDTRKLALLGCAMLVSSAYLTSDNFSQIQEANAVVEDSLSNKEIQRLREGDPMVEQYEAPGLGNNLTNPVENDTGKLRTDREGSDIVAQEQKLDDEFQQLVDRISTDIEERQQGYVSNFMSMASQTFYEQSEEMLTNHLLDVGTFFLLGMALFKSGFLTGLWSGNRYFTIAIIGYLLGIAFGLLSNFNYVDGTIMGALSNAVGDYLYDFRRLSLALGNFSLMALLMRFAGSSWIKTSLAACGRMAMSLYIGQTVICNSIFLGFGLSLYGQLEHFQIAGIAALLTILQLIIAPVYLSWFRQGPFEWLIRRLVQYNSK